MPTLSITDFRHGLDVRKSALTAPEGSLRVLQNVVLTPGGELEKRLAFVPQGTLPAECFGLISAGGQLHTFGTAAAPALPALPVPIVYHQLAAPPSPLNRVIDIEVYKGQFYVSALLNDGSLQNWWAGTLRAGAPGDYARVYRSKMYRTSQQYLRFSSVDDPSSDNNTVAQPGGGFIDVSANDPDAEFLRGLEIYYNQLSIFARHTTQIWAVDPDPSLNSLKQVIRIGALAPASIFQFGTGDVLFLSDSGIRSLRALNTTLAAGVIDVGSPIDKLVTQATLASITDATRAQAIVQPVSGRYWVSIGTTLYCLSFFPSAKISAWSTFTLTFTPAFFVVVGNNVFVMDTANAIYLYGGTDGATYDSAEVRVRTPHFPADKPTVLKKVQSVAAVATGTWSMGLGMVAANTDLFEPVANFVGSTITQHRIAAAGHGTHMALELVCSSGAAASLSALALNYSDNEKL